MKMRKVRLKASIPICVVCLATFSGVELCYSQGNEPEYRGVSGAEVRSEAGQIKSGESARVVEMGDRLIVEASNLDGWLYESVKGGDFSKQEWFDPAAIKAIADIDLKTLYERTNLKDQNQLLKQVRDSVDRMLSDVKQRLYLQLGPARLRHLHAEDPLVRQNENGIFRFVFPVREASEDRAEWNKLRNIHRSLRPISISLAFDTEGVTHTLRTKLGSSLDSVSARRPEERFYFRIFSWCSVTAVGVVYLVAILVFCWFAGAPNLLRDPDAPMREERHIFSLSRCQLAWWFFVILAAWGFLFVITHSPDTLNQTALILLGIGSGTALSGAVAGSVKTSLRDEKEKKLSEVELDIAKRPSGFRRGPGAWLYDILSDTDTVGFHRFQLIVWNVILGGVFLIWTWSDFAMPEFNATLLALLGLSAATFVGMKMTAGQ
jgi:hypothetical protein